MNEDVDDDIGSSFEDLYEHAPCGYLSTTVDGTITRVNDTLLSWTGFQRADLIGRPFVSCFQPGSQLLFETRYSSVLHLRGEANEVALSVRTAGGDPLPVLINGVLIRNEDGSPRAIRAAVFGARQRQEYERELLTARRLAETSEARVRVLQSASSDFTAASTETDLAERLGESAREALAASHVSVYLLDDEGSAHLVSGPPVLGLTTFVERETDAALMDAVRETVVQRGAIAASSSTLTTAMRDTQIETLATAPITEDETHFGFVVSAFKRSRTLASTDIELLGALALQAAHVLTRMRLQRQLEHLALYDQLTGLASRRLILQLLAEALTAMQPHELGLALIFIDLDGFKAINDELGHSAGDSALREIGTRLSDAVRHGDAVGRLGGDEFVIICTDIGADATQRVVDRLHAALHEPLSDRVSGVRLTCSIGVSLYSNGGTPPPELMLERADAAMYRSKRAGKNRTTTVQVHEVTGVDS